MLTVCRDMTHSSIDSVSQISLPCVKDFHLLQCHRVEVTWRSLATVCCSGWQANFHGNLISKIQFLFVTKNSSECIRYMCICYQCTTADFILGSFNFTSLFDIVSVHTKSLIDHCDWIRRVPQTNILY